MTYRKKLIEVALPLDAISKQSAGEKTIVHGHPATLHLWWSRKPLATCRAVLFASLVDDPSEHPELFPTEEQQEVERERLFHLLEELIKWENSNDEKILGEAQTEILKSTGGNPPPFLDPFAGGGSIPLEAQRLGLEVHASDLNPVAVLINKALIEIPPKFAGLPPVNPEARKSLVDSDWRGTRGLANDVRYYGKWMCDEAERRIGHLYPKVTLPNEYGGGKATVIAWLWVRTVACPNPACGVQMPLASEWWLSSKKGKEVWVEPRVSNDNVISYAIHSGLQDQNHPKDIGLGTSFSGKDGKKTKATFRCIVCNVGIAKGDYIDSEANAGRMNNAPVAAVVKGKKGRIYLSIDNEQMKVIVEQSMHYLSAPAMQEKKPMEPARGTFASNAQGRIYGFKVFANYFTFRQLVALITFCMLIEESRNQVISDAKYLHLSSQQVVEYANAVSTYLSLVLDKCVDYWSSVCSWQSGRDTMRNTFARQAISMVWDFAEANPFSESTGNFQGTVDRIADVVRNMPCNIPGQAVQRDAMATVNGVTGPLISTDPPYYDNVSYADLSDFFYVWLRRSLSSIYPELFSTILVPKAQELIATPYRFNGSKSEAQKFFETGLGKAFEHMRSVQNVDYPLTIYYAFKQAESETDTGGVDSITNDYPARVTASTGWETMLEGLIRSGFTIKGTWPIRTEMTNRSVGMGTNALASSIVLVCRPRPVDAPIASRRQFLNELKAELPQALKQMQHGSVAPVDLAQASIGPGMAIYSRYSKVIEADGTPIRVRTALQLINRALDDVLAEQEGESDVETRWAIAWFETYAMDEGPYGQAETLSKAKNTAIQTLVDTGILEAKAGKVRLLRPEEFSEKWQPEANPHLTAWEVLQRAIYALDKHGEVASGNVLGRAGDLADVVRDLAYRLYTICERKGWAQEAQAYNMLVTSWSGIRDQIHTLARTPQQVTFAFEK